MAKKIVIAPPVISSAVAQNIVVDPAHVEQPNNILDSFINSDDTKENENESDVQNNEQKDDLDWESDQDKQDTPKVEAPKEKEKPRQEKTPAKNDLSNIPKKYWKFQTV